MPRGSAHTVQRHVERQPACEKEPRSSLVAAQKFHILAVNLMESEAMAPLCKNAAVQLINCITLSFCP
eukprot:9466283-Pyramimonas_sp.AAC.1